jgi:acetyl esterase/lipase
MIALLKRKMVYLAKLIGIRILRILVKGGAKLATPALPTPPPKAHRTVHIPSRSDKRRKIRCDVYLPSSLTRPDSQDKRQESALPVVVNLHGSGFTLYAIGDDARFCQLIADSVPCVVVDVDYSKGPERPYPTANEDVDTVLDWISGEGGAPTPKQAFATEHGNVHTRQDRIALTGFSAGGNLALTACVRAYNTGRLGHIPAVLAFYPSTNLSESPHNKPKVKPIKGASGGVLPAPVRSFFYSCYLRPDAVTDLPARGSPLISPLYADAACFPASVTIFTCSGDSLEREGRQMAEHIVAGRATQEQRTAWKASASSFASPPADVADVDRLPLPANEERAGVVWWQAPGQGHAWDKMVKAGSEPERLRDEAYAIAVDRLRKALL